MKNVEAFIVHLARAAQRRPQVDALVADLSMPAHIVDAVDGLRLSPDEMAAIYRPGLHRPRYPFPLRPTEIGCFLSHREAWRTIVERGLDAGLVVEDDVAIDPVAFPVLLDFAVANCKRDDIIRFPYRDHTDGGDEVASIGGNRLIKPRLAGLGMQMQLVGAGAAATLLAATETFDRPVDTTIQLPGLIKARILVARPTCIRQIGHLLGGTVVQKTQKPMGEIVSREIRRAIYRAAIRIRSFHGR